MNRRRIAVLTASIDREYQRVFATSLAAAGAEMGIDICFFNSQGHPNFDVFTSYAEESVIYDLPALGEFDGVISMLATMGSEAVAMKLRRLLKTIEGKPHVSIDVPVDGAVTLTFDDTASVEALTEHLVEVHGARRFACINGPMESAVAMNRLEACRRALARRGIGLPDDGILDGRWTRAGGREAMEALLASGRGLPEAVMCGNDDMAISAIECLNEHGYRVPEDVRVTGFDALNEAVSRGVTTIARPIRRAARESVEILKAWMDTGDAPAERVRVLPTVPVYGDSCGCFQDPVKMNWQLRTMLSERMSLEHVLTQTSMFFNRLTCVGDEQEARDALRAFARNWDIREMYLCVDPAVCRGNEVEKGITAWRPTRQAEDEDMEQGIVYPPDIQLIFGVRDGVELPSEMFSVSDLIPDFDELREGALALVFCPLYYRGRNFGYVAMDLGTGTCPALYSIMMLLSGSLMSLYLQANIRKNAAMFDMTIHDIMTGLLNRRGYVEQAPAVFERAMRENRVFAVISADMDHLKTINDAYGHPIGDEAIRRIGKCLLVLEKEDMTPVHISGDEFVLYGILRDPASPRLLLDEIREEIDHANHDDPWICNISASLGIYAAVPHAGQVIDDFLAKADRAMYKDKNRKKRK